MKGHEVSETETCPDLIPWCSWAGYHEHHRVGDCAWVVVDLFGDVLCAERVHPDTDCRMDIGLWPTSM